MCANFQFFATETKNTLGYAVNMNVCEHLNWNREGLLI